MLTVEILRAATSGSFRSEIRLQASGFEVLSTSKKMKCL